MNHRWARLLALCLALTLLFSRGEQTIAAVPDAAAIAVAAIFPDAGICSASHGEGGTPLACDHSCCWHHLHTSPMLPPPRPPLPIRVGPPFVSRLVPASSLQAARRPVTPAQPRAPPSILPQTLS